MDHIDSLNVINFSKCKLNNALTTPSNQDFVSTACNHLPGNTHVRNKCAVNVTSDNIPCCTYTGKINHLMTKGSVTNGPAYARGSSTAEVNTYCSFKGKPKNQFLLATAIVEIQNESGQYIPCRALLDSASQSQFIPEICVQRFRLSRTQVIHKYRAYLVSTLRHIRVSQFI